MFEEALPFILIMIPIAMKLGFDSIVGTASVLVGVSAGFTTAFANPFTIGVAQGIAGLPLFSGMGPRIVFGIVFIVVSIVYVMLYARKIKADPSKSVVYKEDQMRNLDTDGINQQTLTKRHWATLAVLVMTLVVLGYGIIQHGWYMTEIAALFLVMGVVIGVVNRMRVNEIAEKFVKGCEELVVGALVVGFAYGALVILQNASVIDTILYGITDFVSGMPASLQPLACTLHSPC